MSINALDPKIAKFLTTTQVITSVPTAVKELVENSIDAKASSIDIKLVDNGTSLIEVSDDGIGISEPDTPFMALQSYTSKIKDFSDLDTLESYGFRGEALSSLCRVAEVTIITKTRDDEAARSYGINHDGCIENFELCYHSVGTTVRAKFLFKDLPVRRQIMINSKRSNVEVQNILRSFAICQPKIRINLRVNGNNVMTKLSTETTRETLSCLFGNKFVALIDFIEKKTCEAMIKLTIPRPEATESNEIFQVGQHIFVNQRPIFYKDIEKLINKRFVDFFGDKISARKKLPFFLSLDVPTTELDVNLEPNKTSVLLTNQAKILETLDQMLIKYYEIVPKTQKISNESLTNIDTSLEYHDATSSETSISRQSSDSPYAKKRKIETEKSKTKTKIGCNARAKDSNKENHSSNAFLEKATSDEERNEEIVETISQLPVVDLGEDFSTQEISNLPNLDPCQVEAILGNTRIGADKAKETMVKNGNLTLEAWSKGQVPNNLRGGTDVQIYGNFIENVKSKVEETNEPDTISRGCKGFLKFSKEIRPLIIRENPDINFVEMAKTLMSRWRELSSEERGYYRDIANSDKTQLNKYDNSQSSVKSQKKTKVTSDTSEKNRKRLLDMLENMRNKKNVPRMENSIGKTLVPLAIDMESVALKFNDRLKFDRAKKNIVLGPVSENFWIVRTGSQIWALSIGQLYEGLGLEKSNFIGITRESLEELVERWLNEKDGMSLLHPVFDLR